MCLGGPAISSGSVVERFGEYVSLVWTRRITAGFAVLGLLVLGLVGTTASAERLAGSVFVCLCAAVVCGWLELWTARTASLPSVPMDGPRRKTVSRGAWAPLAAATLGPALFVQTWFRAGTSIATIDIWPPNGTAWLTRLFASWVWSGSNLGGPSRLQLQAPWAAVLAVVHGLGGSPELAQRLWYTALFAGAAVAAYFLMTTLGIHPLAALVGAYAFVFSAYVVSTVNIYSNYLTALVLIALMPALILAAAKGTMRVLTVVLGVALTAPLLGYAYLNPPLVGMVLLSLFFAPVMAGLLWGRRAAVRAVKTIALALPLLLLLSAYWVVPAALQLGTAATSQLSSISSWDWTEVRATLRNAFWLNTTWQWRFPEYNPYASTYDLLPLSVIRFAVPAVAFGALSFASSAGPSFDSSDRKSTLRVALPMATVALVLIFISTGTNPPGNVLFDLVYRLPFGWLLREPGRFLMAAALAYAVLIGLTADLLRRLLWHSRDERLIVGLKFAAVGVLALVVISPGYPLLTGEVVPDHRPTLPAAHVHMPTYWAEMAMFLDTDPVNGNVLVMPPDDFYEMPYRWGYYGTDEFIPQLMQRQVVAPNGQGYYPATPQLLTTVNLAAQAILAGDWKGVERLLRILQTPLVLVRGDIDATFPGRKIVPPESLSIMLEKSPNFQMVDRAGPLELFALKTQPLAIEASSRFATVNTDSPDLRMLAVLPDKTSLVSRRAKSGITSILQAPALGSWHEQDSVLSWTVAQPSGWAYAIYAAYGDGRLVRLEPAAKHLTTRANAFSMVRTDARTVQIQLAGRSVLSDGTFQEGPWPAIPDCYNVLGATAAPYLGAEVLQGGPGGVPYTRLSASLDSSCIFHRVDWGGGPVLLSLGLRHIAGAPARLCLWEYGANRCANSEPLPAGNGWVDFRATISPDPGTTGLSLFLYADSDRTAPQTINEYTRIQLIELPTLGQIFQIGSPVTAPEAAWQLTVLHNAYSNQWQMNGVTSPEHVLVDGLLNGWLMVESRDVVRAYDTTRFLIELATLVSGAVLVMTLLVFFWHLFPRRGM